MRIENLTPFDSEQLRAIAKRVAEDELNPEHRNNIVVHFTIRKAKNAKAKRARFLGYNRRRSGKVPEGLRFNQAIVTIPRQEAIDCPRATAQHTALLLAHEFAEMRSLSHEAMRTKRYFFKEGWQDLYAWANELPLRLAVKEVIIPVNNFYTKLQKATMRRVIAQTRLKRATTIFKKWDRKVKYYEKKASQTLQAVQGESK